MAHVYFYTLKYPEKLRASGMQEQQAKALVDAQRESLSESLETAVATKGDISDLKSKIERLVTKTTLHGWMLGFIFSGIVALIIKAFF